MFSIILSERRTLRFYNALTSGPSQKSASSAFVKLLYAIATLYDQCSKWNTFIGGLARELPASTKRFEAYLILYCSPNPGSAWVPEGCRRPTRVVIRVVVLGRRVVSDVCYRVAKL